MKVPDIEILCFFLVFIPKKRTLLLPFNHFYQTGMYPRVFVGYLIFVYHLKADLMTSKIYVKEKKHCVGFPGRRLLMMACRRYPKKLLDSQKCLVNGKKSARTLKKHQPFGGARGIMPFIKHYRNYLREREGKN